MKKILFLFSTILYTALWSQNEIIDINDVKYNSLLDTNTNYYKKDLNNLLDPFQGTYVYTNGNKSLKIILVKKIKQYNNVYYEDLIIGEYEYSVNGTIVQNTIPNLNVVDSNQFLGHAIAGSSTIDNNNRQWKCPQCNPNEKRLRGIITDRSTERSADFFIRKTTVNGQEVLQVNVGQVMVDIENMNPPDFSLPRGEFTMIKQ